MASIKNTVINDDSFIQLPRGNIDDRPSSPQVGMLRFNTELGRAEVWNGNKWAVFSFNPVQASGGNINEVELAGTNYRIHAFTSIGNDTFTVSNPGSAGAVDVLIVAGGGSSDGDVAGAGGAGGLIFSQEQPIDAQSYTITVGDGGAEFDGDPRTTGESYPTGRNGDNSSAFGLTAIGGGRGGNYNTNNGGNGGSGGGSGGGTSFNSGGSGTTGQGNGGGDHDGGTSPQRSPGGGGAGAAGGNSSSSAGGAGGAGLYYGDIFSDSYGENGFFAGGGGGGYQGSNTGAGGIGGGGDGKDRVTAFRGNDGLPNTGGGGGGNAHPHEGRAGGGSGVVLIRYQIG